MTPSIALLVATVAHMAVCACAAAGLVAFGVPEWAAAAFAVCLGWLVIHAISREPGIGRPSHSG